MFTFASYYGVLTELSNFLAFVYLPYVVFVAHKPPNFVPVIIPSSALGVYFRLMLEAMPQSYVTESNVHR